MRFASWISNYTDTVSICNIYCFSTAKMITRNSLSITFTRTFLVFFYNRREYYSIKKDLFFSDVPIPFGYSINTKKLATFPRHIENHVPCTTDVSSSSCAIPYNVPCSIIYGTLSL